MSEDPQYALWHAQNVAYHERYVAPMLRERDRWLEEAREHTRNYEREARRERRRAAAESRRFDKELARSAAEQKEILLESYGVRSFAHRRLVETGWHIAGFSETEDIDAQDAVLREQKFAWRRRVA